MTPSILELITHPFVMTVLDLARPVKPNRQAYLIQWDQQLAPLLDLPVSDITIGFQLTEVRVFHTETSMQAHLDLPPPQAIKRKLSTQRLSFALDVLEAHSSLTPGPIQNLDHLSLINELTALLGHLGEPNYEYQWSWETAGQSRLVEVKDHVPQHTLTLWLCRERLVVSRD